MSKRNATGSRLARKRRKAGVSYDTIDLDAVNARPNKVEDIRVWNMTTSEKTGHVSGTRRNYQHTYENSPEFLREEPPPVEDTNIPVDPGPSELPQAGSATKRKRVRTVKENDSVSSTPISHNQLIINVHRQGWRIGSPCTV